MRSIHTVEYCSHLKWKEILTHATTRTRLEDTELRGTSQTQTDRHVWLHLHEVPSKVRAALVVKTPPASTGDGRDTGVIPGSGRSHGNPRQHSCQENTQDRGAWRAIQSIGSHRVGHD